MKNQPLAPSPSRNILKFKVNILKKVQYHEMFLLLDKPYALTHD